MTKADKQAKEIAALRRELAELKGEVKKATPPAYDREADARSTAEWRDRMHQAAERRANSWQMSGEVLRRHVEACSTRDIQDLVSASHRPLGPSASAVPSSQQLTGIRTGGPASVPGSGTGWARQREWGADGQHPVPGVAAADRLMDEADRRDRLELAQRLAKQQR
jgi:hypothetical protein